LKGVLGYGSFLVRELSFREKAEEGVCLKKDLEKTEERGGRKGSFWWISSENAP